MYDYPAIQYVCYSTHFTASVTPAHLLLISERLTNIKRKEERKKKGIPRLVSFYVSSP
jgi:hypothetical protein